MGLLIPTRTALAARPIEPVERLSPISLDELNAAAALQERVDRKYVLTEDQLAALIDELADRLAVLEIDGRRSSAYESVYFDTPALDSYHGAAYKRRRRFKVRTRSYLDTETTMLEVKTKGVRKRTVKHRIRHDYDQRSTIGEGGFRFVDTETGIEGLGQTLDPTLTTRYDRITLVDLDDVARLTVDAHLSCTDWTEREVGLSDKFVVETKSGGAPSVSDRWLWASGIRPEKISKYCTSLAALHPELPSNKWHRTLARHF
ncbi:MAG: polyphosphate polymerase domain-containing protein [Acidimicrobiales bacterium]